MSKCEFCSCIANFHDHRCELKRDEKYLSYRTNAKILETFIGETDLFVFIYEKLRDSTGDIFYMRIHISGPDNKYACKEKIWGIEEKDYLEAKKPLQTLPIEKRLDMPLSYEGQECFEDDLRGDCQPLEPNTDLEELKDTLDKELDEYAKERDEILDRIYKRW